MFTCVQGIGRAGFIASSNGVYWQPKERVTFDMRIEA